MVKVIMTQVFNSQAQAKKKTRQAGKKGVIFQHPKTASHPADHAAFTQNRDLVKTNKGTAENINPSFYSGLERDY